MQQETVAFENRAGRRLAGALLLPEATGPVPAVLVVHGFRGNRHERHIQAVGRAVVQVGCVVLLADLTDNLGDAEGSFRDLTVSGEIADARDCLGYLARHPMVDGLRLGIAGHSLGGLVSLLAAAGDERVRGVVALSAVFDMASRLPAILGDEFGRWRERGEVEMDPRGSGLMLGYQFFEDLLMQDVPGSLARLRAPLLIVQGDADRGVPVEHARLFEQHAASPLKEVRLLPGADHGYSRNEDLGKVCDLTAAWFRRHLVDGAGAQ